MPVTHSDARGRRDRGAPPPRLDRISAADLTVLATDVGPVPMNVGAALVLDAEGQGFDLDAARVGLADRSAAVPRLRQRLVPVPLGLGRPVWVDDPGFDPTEHITVRHCPEPGDHQALLDLATAEVLRPLPRSRPLWRATLVTGLADGGVGLVLVLHHVLADGVGGLAVLAALADPGAPPSRPARQCLPTPAELARDRLAGVGPTLRRVPRSLARLRRARVELAAGRPRLAPVTSLNVATGPRRHLAAVDVELDLVRQAAHRHGATVNDVLLVAVTDAMGQVLAERRDPIEQLVVSVPITARPTRSLHQLGNQNGVVPIAVDLAGTLPNRLGRVAAQRAVQISGAADRGASADLIGPVFRTLAALGAFRWMIERQRLVNTFLTNLRGPAQALQLQGATIRSIVPITTTPGNVACCFAALSYAGTLTISIVTDPDRVPDRDRLADALEDALAALIRLS